MLRTLPAVALGTALAVVTLTPTAPTSSWAPGRSDQRLVMDSTYLCTGYDGCAKAGYSDAGYGENNGQMYWRMYKGHNCTNYAAYRMVKAGMPNERPWGDGGNATYWGQEMASITDDVPAVGAIAWWRKNVPGAGSAGHVAYVERVLSATEIVISEDSWGGDFHWRTIRKTGTGWPSGFIHFVDKTVQPGAVAPRVVGTAQVGQTLTAGPGRWNPSSVTLRFQWLADGTPVAGATAKTFTPGPDQVGDLMSVRVTASKPGYTAATATAQGDADVAPGQFAGTAAPAITGTPELGETLSATPAGWSPEPEGVVYRWKADGVVVKGRTGPTLPLDESLVDRTITVVQVANRKGYARSEAASEPVGPVVAGTIEVGRPFAPSGVTRVGQTLSVTPGDVSPSDVDVAYTWLRDGTPIAGATGATYVLTAADLGSRITARLTLTKQHYRTVTQAVAFERAVTTVPTVSMTANGRKRGAVVGVVLQAAGAVPAGVVTVSVGQDQVTAKLVDGRARVVLSDLKPGRRTVVVTYAGHGSVEAGRTKGPVTIER